MKGHGILGYINSQRNPETNMYRLWVSDLLFSPQYGCLMLVHHVKVVVWSGCVCVSHFQTPTWIDWYGTMGVWVNSVLIWLYMIMDIYSLNYLNLDSWPIALIIPSRHIKHCPVSPWWNVGGWNREWDHWGWHYIYPGWWFGTMEFYDFPYIYMYIYIGNNHPNWLHTLWEFNIAIENGHRNSEFSIVFPTIKWWIFP